MPVVARRHLPRGLVSGGARISLGLGNRSTREAPAPPPPAGLDLPRRAVRDGLYRVLHFPDTALRPLARHECRRGRHAGWRALTASGVPVDPCGRADGPPRHAPGDPVLRVDGDGAGADLSARAVVLGIAAGAGALWRRALLRLVGLADPDRPTGRRRGRVYRPVQFLRPDWHDPDADDRRRRLGLGRRLALLYAWCRLGWSVDDGAVARARGGDRRSGWAGRASAGGFPRARCDPALPRLPALLRAVGDPGGGDDDGHHVSAHRDQRRAELPLHRLSRWGRPHWYVDRRPLRGHRGHERSRLAAGRTGDAAWRPTAHDAERHGGVDRADQRDTVPRRHFSAAVPGASRAWLAAGYRPAGDVFGPGQSRRTLSPGIGRRAAADDEPPGGDRDPPGDGHDRRPLGRQRELSYSRQLDAASFCSGRVYHRALRALLPGVGSHAQTGRLIAVPSPRPTDAGLCCRQSQRR